FARIGLGLQRSQIGGGMRVPSPGRADVSYHLYGSRVCAPNLPNPTPNLCSQTSSTSSIKPLSRQDELSRHPERSAQSANSNAVILSDRSEAKGVEEPRESSPNENSSSLFNREPGAPPSTRERQGGVSRVVGREKTLPASPMLVNFTPTEKAPTARPITAQGAPGSPASVSRSLGWEALGNGSNEEPRAEGPPYSPVANQPSFFDG